jgi:hypothetical protein
MPPTQFKATYLGGDLRLGTVPLIERILGGKEALIEVAAEGYMKLWVNVQGTRAGVADFYTRVEIAQASKSKHHFGPEMVCYRNAEIQRVERKSNVFGSMGLFSFGAAIYALRVQHGIPVGVVLEVLISMTREQHGHFEVALLEANFNL